MAAFIDPFDVLLNEISYDLTQDNLRSLIQVCRYYIPETEREKIKHGLDVFEILRRRDKVTADRDKICNLLEIIKAVLPPRKDLVRKVETFIKERYVDLPDTVVIIDVDCTTDIDLEASTSSEDGLKLIKNDQHKERPTSGSFTLSPRPRCCTANFCCCGCNCYPRRLSPCFYFSMSAIMAFLAIVAVLAWYGDLPRVQPFLTRDPDLNKAGKYVIGFLCLIAVVLLVFGIRARRNQSQSSGYSMINSDYGSIDRNEDTSWQESMNSLPRNSAVAKDINRKRKASQSTSGCSSRVSQTSILSPPPSVQSSTATIERICEHCAGGCPVCGQPPTSRISSHHTRGNFMGIEASLGRMQGCRPECVPREAAAVCGTGSQACKFQKELDHDVEPDVMVRTPGHGDAEDSESLNHSHSSGIFVSAVEEDDFQSFISSYSGETK